MNARLTVWLLSLFGLSLFAAGVEPGPVIVVPIRTEISPTQFFFLRRVVKDAERQGAQALVLDMETFGGEVSAALDSMDALLKTKVPTYTYVNNKAISAGAMIALATQKIYMSPNAVIGAAAPVQASGENLSSTMADKTVSALSAMARAAAQQNGHNPEIAEAFIHKEKELKIGSEVIDRSDTLLTLSAMEAAKSYEGKPLLAVGVADSLEQMLALADLHGPVQRVSPSGFENLAFWITSIAPLLLLGGFICGYIEIKTPGFGVPGFTSIVCFALFFAGHFVAGLTGWEAAAVFVIGLALVASEVLLHPGTVIPGLVGALMMVGSVVWAMVDRYPNQPLWPSEEMLFHPLLNISAALVGAGVAAAILARYLPQSSFFRRVALVDSLPSGSEAAKPPATRTVQVGWTGIAATSLRPSGKAEFGGHLFDVVSNGAFIDAGQAVRVALIEGARVLVETV